MKVCYFLIGICLFATTGYAQFNQRVLFPGVEGDALVSELQRNYTTGRVLENSENRDTLFGRVYVKNDSLRCVYTGYTIYLDPSQDPTQAAFMNGGPNGINTEHCWPQAFGASNEPAKTDLHHLFPTRADVNARRSNFPFAEINDNQTDVWFYNAQQRTSPPTQNKDAWSEFDGSSFEPREDHKGNTARAMFYFYTIYRDRAEGAGSGYFQRQRETLCRWHHEDPVDQLEYERTWRIARHQDGKANPFVLDCTLAARCYCEDLDERCSFTSDNEADLKDAIALSLTPNPTHDQTRIQFELSNRSQVRLSVWNSMGQELNLLLDQQLNAGPQSLNWSPASANLPAGIYYLNLSVSNQQSSYLDTRKVVFMP